MHLVIVSLCIVLVPCHNCLGWPHIFILRNVLHACHYFISLDWQAVCKLPFIKESRLLTEIAKVESTLMVILMIYRKKHNTCDTVEIF